MALAVGCEGMLQNKQDDFSISVFGRFAYTLSALNEHCPYKEFNAVYFLDNVRSYHTERSQTAGHMILEKSSCLFCNIPSTFVYCFITICLIINSAYCQLSVLDSKGNTWGAVLVVQSEAGHAWA